MGPEGGTRWGRSGYPDVADEAICLQRAQCLDSEHMLIGAGSAQNLVGASGRARRGAVRGGLCVEGDRVIPLSTRGDARRDELDVKVLRVEAAQRVADAGAEHGGQVVKVARRRP